MLSYYRWFILATFTFAGGVLLNGLVLGEVAQAKHLPNKITVLSCASFMMILVGLDLNQGFRMRSEYLQRVRELPVIVSDPMAAR